jgi:hypothetical protein
LNSDGTLFWEKSVGDKIYGAPSFADVDLNGSIELFFGAKDGYIYGINSDGSDFVGFPVQIGENVESSPVYSDLDNNGTLEIVFSSTNSKLHALKSDGTYLTPFPIDIETDINNSSSIADIDGDGDLEILYGGNFNTGIIDYKSQASEGVDIWSMYRGDFHRTGLYSGVGTSVKDHFATEVPGKFKLAQNYPNPFNPETTISFQLPTNGGNTRGVNLAIYDISGKLVKTLINGEKEPGYHSVVWDGKNETGNEVSSGVYFYKIDVAAKGHAPLFTETKKMLLLK